LIIEFHKNSEIKPISNRIVQHGGCLRTWGQPNETFSNAYGINGMQCMAHENCWNNTQGTLGNKAYETNFADLWGKF